MTKDVDLTALLIDPLRAHLGMSAARGFPEVLAEAARRGMRVWSAEGAGCDAPGSIFSGVPRCGRPTARITGWVAPTVSGCRHPVLAVRMCAACGSVYDPNRFGSVWERIRITPEVLGLLRAREVLTG